MSHVIQISERAFERFQELASKRGVPPETMVESLIETAGRDGPYYDTDDWFRHLGMSDDDIREARARADQEDADA